MNGIDLSIPIRAAVCITQAKEKSFLLPGVGTAAPPKLYWIQHRHAKSIWLGTAPLVRRSLNLRQERV